MSDPNTVPATVSTPQQQPQGTPTQQNAPTPASVSASSGDQLVCQWQTCGERLPSAEQLYVSHLLLPLRMPELHHRRTPSHCIKSRLRATLSDSY